MKTTLNTPPEKLGLRLVCSGAVDNVKERCVASVDAPLPITAEDLNAGLERIGWFVSVIAGDTKDSGRRTALAVVCDRCAPKLLPPELIEAVRAERLKRKN